MGQDNSTSLDLRKYSGNHTALRDSFKRAGFADATLDEYNLRPCPLGTFVNASRLDCVECPAGKIYIVLHDYYWSFFLSYGDDKFKSQTGVVEFEFWRFTDFDNREVKHHVYV